MKLQKLISRLLFHFANHSPKYFKGGYKSNYKKGLRGRKRKSIGNKINSLIEKILFRKPILSFTGQNTVECTLFYYLTTKDKSYPITKEMKMIKIYRVKIKIRLTKKMNRFLNKLLLKTNQIHSNRRKRDRKNKSYRSSSYCKSARVRSSHLINKEQVIKHPLFIDKRNINDSTR
jgi:hypothetical protein